MASDPGRAPFQLPIVSEPGKSKPGIRNDRSGRDPWAQWANWIVGPAAAVFLLMALGAFWYQRGQLAEIAAEHLRLMVTGPASLHVGVPARYVVKTTSVTGSPVSAHVECTVRGPDGKTWLAHKETADAQGHIQIAITPEPTWPAAARLEVVGVHGARTERVEMPIEVRGEDDVATVAVERAFYRPGQTVRFRLLALARRHLMPLRPSDVRLSLRAPDRSLVPGCVWEGKTMRGMAAGEFALPNDLAPGIYTLLAESRENRFAAVHTPVVVRMAGARQGHIDVEFFTDGYRPGERVVADCRAVGDDGQARSKARWNAQATLLGKPIYTASGETSPDGLFRVAFALPDRMGLGAGWLRVEVADKAGRPSIVRHVPLPLRIPPITFYPEGGELVAGLDQRVYFSARDPRGNPLSLTGRIVNGSGRVVAGAETQQDGMGSFQFPVQAGESYRLVVETPADAPEEIDLPPVANNHGVGVAAGLAIIEPGKPLEFNLRATTDGLPLIAGAFCRGILVGHHALVSVKGTHSVTIPLDADVAGVVRLAIYAYRTDPPKLLAERLFYRRAAKRIQVQVQPSAPMYAPGETADLTFRVADENGAPLRAVLSLVGSGVAGSDTVAQGPASAISQLLLRSELEDRASVDPIALGLSADPKASVTLDLVLGTRAKRLPPTPAEASSGAGDVGRSDPSALQGGTGCLPPLVSDNLGRLLTQYQASLASYRANRTRVLNTLTAMSFFGGIGLVVFVALLSVLNIPCGLRLWGLALAVAAACGGIGAVLMDPAWLKPNATSSVPFASSASVREAPSVAATLSGRPVHSSTDRPLEPTQMAGGEPKLDAKEHFRQQEASPPDPFLWRPLVLTDDHGRASVSVPLPNATGNYRILVDAHAEDGRLGWAVVDLPCQLPFRCEAQVPSEVTLGDRMVVPVRCVNASERPRALELTFDTGPLMHLEGDSKRTRKLESRQEAIEWFSLRTAGTRGQTRLALHVRSGSWSDTQHHAVRVVGTGVPAELSYAGRVAGRAHINVRVPPEALPGSLEAQLRLMPSFWAEVRAAVEGLADQPAAGVEHAVAIAGLSGLGLRDLINRETASPGLVRLARDRLRTASAQWLSHGVPSGGYSPFPGQPADPILTALAVWQFHELAQVGFVWPGASSRATKWLKDRRDASGGWALLPESLGPTGQRVQSVAEVFALWALLRPGQSGLETELKRALERAEACEDPLQLALAAAVSLGANKKAEGRRLLERLAKFQLPDGHLPAGAGLSAFGGASAPIEATALAALAWLNLGDFRAQAERAMGWLATQRQRAGTFGTPRATLLALAALRAGTSQTDARYRDGRFVLRTGGRVLVERVVSGAELDLITIPGLETHLLPGSNPLTVELPDDRPMPYLLSLRFGRPTAPHDPACPLRLAASLPIRKAKFGQRVPVQWTLTNATDQPLAMAVAILGLPAGLEFSAERVEQLKSAGLFDAYQFRPRRLVCYWRTIAPKKAISVNTELVARIPGTYAGPPSVAYLASSPEQTTCIDPLTIEISPQ